MEGLGPLVEGTLEALTSSLRQKRKYDIKGKQNKRFIVSREIFLQEPHINQIKVIFNM